MAGRTPNVNWYTFVNNKILNELGGTEYIKNQLKNEVKIIETKYGFLIKACDALPIGDVNRGANDIIPLKKVAKVLKPQRFEITGFGTPDFDAMAWVERFDE